MFPNPGIFSSFQAILSAFNQSGIIIFLTKVLASQGLPPIKESPNSTSRELWFGRLLLMYQAPVQWVWDIAGMVWEGTN